MKTKLFILATFLILLSSFTVPKVNGLLLNDYANVMNADQKISFNSYLRKYADTSKNEIAVITLSDMGGDEIENVAYNIFHTWGIGKKGLNNGILIVFALKERKYRIQTGYGVEEYLPDGKCKEIQLNYMKPEFKKGNYYEGLYQGCVQIINNLNKANFKEAYKQEIIKEQSKPIDLSIFLEILAIILIVGFISVYIAGIVRRKRKSKALIQEIKKYTSEFKYIINKKSISSKHIFELEDMLSKIIEVRNIKDELMKIKISSISENLLFKDKITSAHKNLLIFISNMNLSTITEADDITSLKRVHDIVDSKKKDIDEYIKNDKDVRNILSNKEKNLKDIIDAYNIHISKYEILHKIEDLKDIKKYSNAEIDSINSLYLALDVNIKDNNLEKSHFTYLCIYDVLHKTLNKYQEILMIEEQYNSYLRYYDENVFKIEAEYHHCERISTSFNSENLRIFSSIKQKYNDFKNTKKTSKFSLGKDLKELLDLIKMVKEKHQKYLNYLEEEKQRKIREQIAAAAAIVAAEEESRRNSYSSSNDSDSGFSFGGGDSGGGGSTDSF